MFKLIMTSIIPKGKKYPSIVVSKKWIYSFIVLPNENRFMYIIM